MEKITCENAIRMALGPEVTGVTIAARAHVVYCRNCSKEFAEFQEKVLVAETVLEEVPLHRLVVRLIRGALEVLETTAQQIIEGTEPIPAMVRLRGKEKREAHRNFVRTEYYIGEGVSIEIRVSGSEKETVDISLDAYHKGVENTREGVSNLEVTLQPESGGPVYAAKTSAEGTAKLGRWGGQGSFTIEVSEAGRKIGKVYFELRKD